MKPAAHEVGKSAYKAEMESRRDGRRDSYGTTIMELGIALGGLAVFCLVLYLAMKRFWD